MKLYLVRHGEAVSKQEDPERPLSKAGKAEVRKVARRLKPLGLKPVRIQHSGKARARQTAELLAKVCGGVEPVACDGLAPDDDVVPVAKEVGGWFEEAMLVGHMPFMGRLASVLLGDGESDVVAFETGTVVCLQRMADGGWRIGWAVGPSLF